MKICSAILFTFLIIGLLCQAKKQPNVIYILADDLGYGEVGYNGQKMIKTPELDALATGGMRFTDHYCGNALCAPSRASLVTGKHPGHDANAGSNAAAPVERTDASDAWNGGHGRSGGPRS